jgi:UDP-N-acetylglucosamine--N-acetylmuramyl-(pentapeptide) pyrophosphoryl-undecaprenol N-acetylglucosamine transferase
LAVAEVLRSRNHDVLYLGTREGIEARLVPDAGYRMAFVRAGALNRVSAGTRLRTALQLPSAIWQARSLLQLNQAAAVFSMGGFVAGPVMAAAVLNRVPLVVMEPNAIPGFANRRVADRVYRALLGFPETQSYFPRNRSEVTGLPVRAPFFSVKPKQEGPFTVLITGGSRGSRSLNRAARETWPLFREARPEARLILQTGSAEHADLARKFEASGLPGEVVPFIRDMPAAFAQADLVVGRSGAGALNEIAAAGMASILVPFPFAADDHQLKNAQVLVNAGAARLIEDRQLTGSRLFAEIESLLSNPVILPRMREVARTFARPGAAERAADVLEEAAHQRKTRRNSPKTQVLR